MEHAYINVSTIPGERVLISFDDTSDATVFLSFVNCINANYTVLYLNSVYAKLGVDMPEVFTHQDLGWFTPVHYSVLHGQNTMVYLDQPIRRITDQATALRGEDMTVASFRKAFDPWFKLKPLNLDEWSQYSAASNNGVYWKSLDRFKPVSPIWKRLAHGEYKLPEPEVPYPTKVIRSGPVTIAVWPDKSKTYVRIKGDDMSQNDPEKALALVTLKKLLGPHKFRKLFKEFLGKK